LPDAHRNCPRRHGRQIRKPAFAQLLAPAGFIEFDDLIGGIGLEVGGRIVEGQMAVLADPGKAHIYGVPRNQFAQPLDLSVEIGGVSIDLHEDRLAGQAIHDALAQILPKARAMRHR
jgi:hypothetical protein